MSLLIDCEIPPGNWASPAPMSRADRISMIGLMGIETNMKSVSTKKGMALQVQTTVLALVDERASLAVKIPRVIERR